MKNIEITWADFPGPCYDPQKGYGDCPATFLELLNMENIPAEDRVWAFCNCTAISDSHKRLFAVRCVRETPTGQGRFVFDLLEDTRSIKAIEVAQAHAIGMATDQDLAAASAAAWDAARAAACEAASSAAWGAASSAAWDAARDAARAAACAAAREAAREAAWGAASEAVRSGGWEAALGAQLDIIKSMITEQAGFP